MDKRLRVFISQPMNDKSMVSVLNERKEAIKQVELLLQMSCPRSYFGGLNDILALDNVNRLDPYVFVKVDEEAITKKRVSMLGNSLMIMATADVVYFAKGWENAEGCQIEYKVAKEYFGTGAVWTYAEYKTAREKFKDSNRN